MPCTEFKFVAQSVLHSVFKWGCWLHARIRKERIKTFVIRLSHACACCRISIVCSRLSNKGRSLRHLSSLKFNTRLQLCCSFKLLLARTRTDSFSSSLKWTVCVSRLCSVPSRLFIFWLVLWQRPNSERSLQPAFFINDSMVIAVAAPIANKKVGRLRLCIWSVCSVHRLSPRQLLCFFSFLLCHNPSEWKKLNLQNGAAIVFFVPGCCRT